MKIKIKEILNINLFNKIINDFYQITNIPIAIVDSNGGFICCYGWATECFNIKCEYEELQSFCLLEYWKNNTISINNIQELSCLHGLKMYRIPVYIKESLVANVFLKTSFENNITKEPITDMVVFFENIINVIGDFVTKVIDETQIENARIINYDEMKISYNNMVSVNNELRYKIWELEKMIQKERTVRSKAPCEDEKKYIMETVSALSYMIEKKDIHTARHQRKVAYLANRIATKLKLSAEQSEGLYVAALLHDIGKIGIPSEILGKADKLTELEFEIVKTHVQLGDDILSGVSFPWPVAKIALQHHEKINGSGYPYGLKDKDICLEAKIIAVADVVEAITAHRSYKPSLSMAYAMEEIKKYSGVYYDSNVVDACLLIYMEGTWSKKDNEYHSFHNMD